MNHKFNELSKAQQALATCAAQARENGVDLQLGTAFDDILGEESCAVVIENTGQPESVDNEIIVEASDHLSRLVDEFLNADIRDSMVLSQNAVTVKCETVEEARMLRERAQSALTASLSM